MKEYIGFILHSILFVNIWVVTEYIETALNPKSILLVE